MQTATEIRSNNRPDNLLIALVIDKARKTHVKTLVGHYSELLPGVDLTDKKQKAQLYQEFGGHVLVFLHNLLKVKTDFRKFFDYCQAGRVLINFEDTFNDLEYILNHYTTATEYSYIPKYPVRGAIFQDAVRIRQDIRQRRREYNLLSVSTPGYSAPVELGDFLKGIVR